MRVLIADKFEAEGVEGLGSIGCEVVHEPGVTPDTMAEALTRIDPEVLVVRSTKVLAPAIAAAKSLRYIIRAGSGYDNIDRDAAGAKGISVSNCPGMNAVAVAELAMGHLINLDRRLPEQDAALKNGTWNKKEYGKARGLKGLNLFVHGFGAIGQEVASRAKAFGMHVYTTSHHLTAGEVERLGATLIGPERDGVLAKLPEMDAVSVHVPVTDETRGSLNAEFFGAMKPGSYFVNTSRGPVVDEQALMEACRTKGIRAALDVYCDQPATPEADWRPEVACESGVYCSHHCGASTNQAQLAVAEEVVRLVQVYKDTGSCEHVVNAEAVRTASAGA
ncbi:MAG: NAD(P)-dependent oxidoreductase [Phycisphaerales bacterium JB058]